MPKSVVLPVPLRPIRPTRAPVGMRAEARSNNMRPAMRTLRSSMTSMSRLLTDSAVRSNPFGKSPLAELAHTALPGLALIDDEVETRRAVFADDGAQQRMCL